MSYLFTLHIGTHRCLDKILGDFAKNEKSLMAKLGVIIFLNLPVSCLFIFLLYQESKITYLLQSQHKTRLPP